jgi:NAD(P) transhydrogenase subunit alpha
MAVEQGGNCAVSEPGQTVVRHGVTIIGQPNLPATVPADASALYSRNVLDFLKLVLTKEGGLTVNREDDIVAACLLCSGGEIVRRNG